MYDNIKDVPKAISEFYRIEVREDGEYVVQIEQPPFESLSGLEQVIDHNSLKRDKRWFINKSTQAYLDWLQWEWFASYKEWQEECKRIDDLPDSQIVDEVEIPLTKEYPTEPTRPEKISVVDYQLRNYRFFRRYASAQVQDEMRYDDAVNGTDTWLQHNKDVKNFWKKP